MLSIHPIRRYPRHLLLAALGTLAGVALALLALRPLAGPADTRRPVETPGRGGAPLDTIYLETTGNADTRALVRVTEGGGVEEFPAGIVTRDGAAVISYDLRDGARPSYRITSTATGETAGPYPLPAGATPLLEAGGLLYVTVPAGSGHAVLAGPVGGDAFQPLPAGTLPGAPWASVFAGGSLFVLAVAERGDAHVVRIAAEGTTRTDISLDRPVPAGLTDLIVDETGTRAFVIDLPARTVDAFHAESGERVGSVAYGGHADGGSAARRLWDHLIGLVAPTPAAAKAVVSPGGALSPDGQRLYVADLEAREIAVIDTRTLAVVGRHAVGAAIHSVRLNPEGTALYVLDRDARSVTVLDPSTGGITARFDIGRRSPAAPGTLAAICAPDGARCR